MHWNQIEVSSALASMTVALGFFEDIFRMRGDMQLGIAIRACHEAWTYILLLCHNSEQILMEIHTLSRSVRIVWQANQWQRALNLFAARDLRVSLCLVWLSSEAPKSGSSGEDGQRSVGALRFGGWVGKAFEFQFAVRHWICIRQDFTAFEMMGCLFGNRPFAFAGGGHFSYFPSNRYHWNCQERLDLTLEIFEWLRPPLELWNAAMACQDRFIHRTWLDSTWKRHTSELSVFLGTNFESRATGNRPYSSSQVRCYAKLKSYQPTSQHLTMWTFQHSCSFKCQVCSRLETSDFVMLSFTSNVKCFEFDVGSPLGAVTWCIFLQFGDESMWSGCHPRCTNALWCTKPLYVFSRLPLARYFGLASGAENSQTESLRCLIVMDTIVIGLVDEFTV